MDKTTGKRRSQMRAWRWITQAWLLIIAVSCNSDDRLDADISGVQVQQEWRYLNRDFPKLLQGEYPRVNDSLLQEYGTFYKRYIQNILGLGHVQDPSLVYAVRDFLQDPVVDTVWREVGKQWSDLSGVQQELETSFRYYHYHFPQAPVPDVVPFIGVFNYNVAVTDSALGIGLEHYLGPEYPLYARIGLPAYLVENMDASYLVPDAMRGWLLSEFGASEGNDLLSTMVTYGKIMYAMDACFPSMPDYRKIGYTEAQQAWCINNEWQIWSQIMDSELLYVTDPKQIKRYISDGPFTPGMPRESPARIGYWVGWQIVRAYMEEHPETTVQQLMEMTQARAILQASAYKPSK